MATLVVAPAGGQPITSAPPPPPHLDTAKAATRQQAHAEQKHSTTWSDLDSSKYAMYGSAFVLGVDSLMYPFETLRTKMQADSVADQRSVAKMAARIVRTEGVKRLYKGMAPAVLGSFPAQATYYGGYEWSHGVLEAAARRWAGVPEGQELSPVQDFFCHSLAGLSAETLSACFYLPADTVSQRLQAQPAFNFHHREHQYSGAGDVVRSILRASGPRGFYRGLAPHLLAYGPAGFAYFGAFEAAKKGMYRAQWDEHLNSNVITAMAASLAGGCSVIASNPFDVLRTRVQTYQSSAGQPKQGIFAMVHHVYATEGLAGLYKGVRPRLVVALPGSMISLLGYETIKGWAKAD